jgi:hypothetical protein
VLVATWLQLARLSGTWKPWNALWAEDGAVFLTNAYQRGLSGNLFRPHAGYYQVIARLVAQPAAHLPVSWAAAWMAWTAAAVVAGCSLIVWFRARQVTRHLGARVIVTLLVPLMGQLGYEVSGTVTDLHWFLLYTLFWVLIAPPKSWRGCVGAAAFAVLVALSDPLAGLMLLAGAVGWWTCGRRWQATVAPVAMLPALLAQYLVHSAGAFNAFDKASLPAIYAVRVVLSSFTGDHLLPTIYGPFGLAAAATACVVMATLVILLLRHVQIRTLVISISCFVLSAAFLAVELETRGTTGFLAHAPVSLNGSRYTVVPLWLLLTGIILLADGWVRPTSGRIRLATISGIPLALALVCSWLAVETLSDWSEPSVRNGSPAWNIQVSEARASCKGPLAARYRVPPGLREGPVGPDDVVIPVAPLPPGQQPVFAVTVSCSRLLG